LRNPFEFAIQPTTATTFINDVGEDAWEEINRGLRELTTGGLDMKAPSRTLRTAILSSPTGMAA
jgi:hypothetical protein